MENKLLLLAVGATLLFASCKKKNEEPAPVHPVPTTTTPTNQPGTGGDNQECRIKSFYTKDYPDSRVPLLYDESGKLSEYINEGETFTILYNSQDQIVKMIAPTEEYSYSYNSQGQLSLEVSLDSDYSGDSTFYNYISEDTIEVIQMSFQKGFESTTYTTYLVIDQSGNLSKQLIKNNNQFYEQIIYEYYDEPYQHPLAVLPQPVPYKKLIKKLNLYQYDIEGNQTYAGYYSYNYRKNDKGQVIEEDFTTDMVTINYTITSIWEYECF